MGKPTVNTLNRELKRFGITPDSKEYVSALVLLSSAIYGPNADRIAKLIGKTRSQIRTIGHRLRSNHIWQRDKICCDWFGKDGGISFCLDVNVAAGFLERA